MSPRNVTEGAKCKCSLGTHSATLGFPSCKTIQLRHSTALNIYDQKFLAPFGSCLRDKTKCLPCTPTPDGPWSSEAPKVIFGDEETLVETAKMGCALGGEITITDPGPEDIYSGDVAFVAADGTVILSGVSRADAVKRREAEGVQEFIDRADSYRENPVVDAIGEIAKALSDAKKNEDIMRPPGDPKRRRPGGRGSRGR